MPDDAPRGIGDNGGPPLIELPAKLLAVFFNPDGSWRHSRYKALWGGRGGAKSWAVARILIALAVGSKVRVLCAREFQVSIADSVHKLLSEQIDAMGLAPWLTVTDKTIYCHVTGSEFLFKGLRRNIREIKSLEGIDYVWVEEAQGVSKESWQILRPTIRKSGSEIWATFNPDGEEDPTYQFFVAEHEAGKHPNMLSERVGWQDNPWFSEELNMERLADLAADDPDAYQWIWEGDPRKISDAIIFRHRINYDPFEEPNDPHLRIYYGADWGFASDPTALIRFYITEVENPERPGYPDQHLWITHEAFGWHVEIDDLHKLFDKVPGSRNWPIRADNARPETISYMSRQGFNITAAEKWPGSVEDGIAHLKGYKMIHIHPNCEHIAREARLYKYKTDPKTNDVLPIIIDKWNHGWDAVRYGHDGIIQHRGGAGVWRKLAQ